MVPRINLILNLICRDYLADRAALDTSFQFHPVIFGADNPQCQIPEVQALVARFQLYSNLIAGILSAIVSPKMGVLSDRYGRKRIIAIATLGTLLGEAITVLIASYPDDFSVNWILLGSFFDGLCGSFTTAMALIHAYNADCTPPERRNVTFAYFHATLFTGIAAGPILAGYLVNWTGHIITVFYVAIGCHLFFLIFLFFIIPESVSKERQMIAREKWRTKMLDPEERTWILTARNYNVLAMTKSFFQPLGILRPTGPGSSRDLRRNLFFLAAIDTAMFGVAMGTMNVIVIYSEYMFGWGNLESSIFVSIVNTCRVCGLLLILPTVTRIVRGPMSSRRQQRNSGSDLLDINIIRIAILFDLTGYIGYSTVRKGYLLIISGAIASLGGMGSPTLQSALTKHVPPDRTGQLLGATGLLHALARVIAPTIFNLIYSVTVGKFTQTVFVCLASVFGVASVFSWFIKPHGELNLEYIDIEMELILFLQCTSMILSHRIRIQIHGQGQVDWRKSVKVEQAGQMIRYDNEAL